MKYLIKARMTKKKVIALFVGVAVVAAGGFAFAMWSASGTGAGGASSLTAQSITVTASTGAADLYPGFDGGDVYFTLTNNNPYPVQFTSMSSGTVTSSDTDACPSSNVTVDASASGLDLVVAANSTSGTLSIADVVTMSAAAPDGCQGKSFSIVLTLTGTQTTD
jgi:hypothetical protein